WSSGFYRVFAEFNTSDGTESAQSGFSIDTFTVSCFRASWSTLQSGDQTAISCTVSNPAGGNYQNRVDITVESVKNSFTGSSIGSGQSTWFSNTNFTNNSANTAVILLNQSLPTGQYESIVKLNDSSDIKRAYVWFEVKDFEPQFYSFKWSYSTGDNVTLIARGLSTSGVAAYRVNLSGSPTVYRYDRATWARETVSGVTAVSQVDKNLSWNVNVTLINLSKSGGWAEGQYNVLLNLTRINGTNGAQGNPVEVSTWFDVRLFDVWGYASAWSYHPKSNITINVFVGDPSSFNQRYTSRVEVNITEVRNTATGAVLTKGTDYNVVDNTTIPSVTGDVPVNITPINSLPSGSYKAKIAVKDTVSGNTVTTDVYFNVVGFYLSAYSDPYEVGAGENVSITISTYTPSGNGTVSISDAVVTALTFCNVNYICTNKALASFNYTFNKATSRIFVNTTGFGEGWYTAAIVVNDTQNTNATAYSSFRIKSFAISGSIPSPTGARSGYGYQINETIPLNVTGTLGVNITNATFSYYDCTSSGCTYKSFLVQIGYNMTAANVLLGLTPSNITPAVLNKTWPVNEYAYYNIDVKVLKDGVQSSFSTYTYIYFPRATVSGPPSVSADSGIAANITVYVEPVTGQNLSGASITAEDVLQDTGFILVSLGSSKWNATLRIANSSGIAELVVQPNGTWPSGNLRVRYNVVYGNASTKAEFSTATSSRTLGLSKTLTNRTGAVITNGTVGVPFN
ncbi:hypothetical protein HY640_00700, partial [Candidatus Woesearchaeota archaeon]|nr:hypothetical protein [Candidatus Woesearchaeota archaeon]